MTAVGVWKRKGLPNIYRDSPIFLIFHQHYINLWYNKRGFLCPLLILITFTGMMGQMRLFKNRDLAAMFLILEGIVFAMIVNLYNPFIQMFAKRMGGADIHTALLNAAPPLVAIFVLIPCGILIERINRKKQTVILLLGIVSVFYAAIALVPALPHEIKVMAYVVLIGLMNWPGALYITTWQSYFADNFSGSYANRVYSVRSKFSSLFGLVTVLVTGIMLTSIPKSDEERLLLYQIFYGVCFALTLLQILLFSRVRGKRTRNNENTAKNTVAVKQPGIFSRENFSGMLKNRPFIIFCLCGFAFHFAWQMAWPIFFIYNTDYAHLNEFQLSMANVASGLTQFLSFSLWNRLIDKKGSDLIVIIGALGIAISPLMHVTLVSYTVIVIANLVTGVFLAGFNLALFLSLLGTLPKNKKTVYISVFNTIVSITGFISPLVGIFIYNRSSIFFTMGLAGVLRLTGAMLYFLRWRRGKERKDKSNTQSIEVNV